MKRRIIHGQLDEHYRKTRDKPLAVLDGMTPRQAAQAGACGDKVTAWLKLWKTNRIIGGIMTIPSQPTISPGCGASLASRRGVCEHAGGVFKASYYSEVSRLTAESWRSQAGQT